MNSSDTEFVKLLEFQDTCLFDGGAELIEKIAIECERTTIEII